MLPSVTNCNRILPRLKDGEVFGFFFVLMVSGKLERYEPGFL